MGLRRLHAFLRRHARIAIDSNVLIYHLEGNERYVPATSALFSWIDQSGSVGLLSTLTMTEVLVQPFRIGDDAKARLFQSLLTTYPNLEWVAPDLQIATVAAQYRARYGLKTIDALLAATASVSQATGLITNDAVLARVDGLDVLVLDQLL